MIIKFPMVIQVEAKGEEEAKAIIEKVKELAGEHKTSSIPLAKMEDIKIEMFVWEITEMTEILWARIEKIIQHEIKNGNLLK